ncbi:hypothetical protein M422DRAFT_25811 [Sphaerobolus stellatus SS14]|nr:hypothetical protein M422DRAFT_25811 [Sphaerobolus stellatus SS14]
MDVDHPRSPEVSDMYELEYAKIHFPLHIQSSDRYLSDSERVVIEQNIYIASRHMEGVEENISSIQDTIKRLQREIYLLYETSHRRERVLDHTNKYLYNQRSLVAPVQKLPDELLIHIFSECRWTTRYNQLGIPNIVPDDVTRWLFSGVCRRWRRVALSVGTLWSCIDFVPDSEDPLKRLDKFRTCLTRSGNAPLEIQYWSGGDPTGDEPIVKLLLESSHRWKSAYIGRTSLRTRYSGGISRISDKHPLLKYLSLENYSSEVYGHLFMDAPRLTHLEIRWFSGSRNVSFLGIPWSQITHFTLSSQVPVRPYYEAVRSMHMLQELRISCSVIASIFSLDVHVSLSDWPVEMTANLPSLRKLYLGLNGSVDHHTAFLWAGLHPPSSSSEYPFAALRMIELRYIQELDSPYNQENALMLEILQEWAEAEIIQLRLELGSERRNRMLDHDL